MAGNKSLGEALAAGPLADLLHRARKLDEIARAIAQVNRENQSGDAPSPVLHCAIEGRTLIISVATASYAARLRQQMAQIDEVAGKLAPELTAIRIRLQPGASTYPMTGIKSTLGASPEPAAPVPGNEAVIAALRFAEVLAADATDSPLRRAARRLQATLRARIDRRR